MPGESGLDLVEDALRRHERMAALMVSGLDDVALAERALRIGAYGYVVKPFSINDVLIAVLGALRHRRAATQDPSGMGEDTIRRLCVAVEARDVRHRGTHRPHERALLADRTGARASPRALRPAAHRQSDA